MKYLERPCAGGCGTVVDQAWPTCGAPACKAAHLREVNARNQRERYDRLLAAGRCVKCGFKIPADLRSKSTGTKPHRCAGCLAGGRRSAKSKRAEVAAVRRVRRARERVAANAVKRERNNLIRIAAGMAPSFSTSSTALPQEIVETQEI